MGIDIALFPVLTDKLINKFRYQASEYSFYYNNGAEELNLDKDEIEGSSSIYIITDKEGLWTSDDYNLCIRRNYSLKTYQCLFGKSGIVSRNSILGLALRWTSSDSKQRGVIEIGEIKNTFEDLYLELDFKFTKGQIRGEVELITVIYIKKPNRPSSDEKHLANFSGCILGELDKIIIKLDGSGSIFPIYEISEEDHPLWYIKCEWEDPTYDNFIESISIYINKAHKNYKYLDKSSKNFDIQLLKEIIASALSILITKLKEQDNYWDTTLNGNDLHIGSVSHAVNYFINTFDWDVNTPEIMSLSIRKFLDQRM